MGVCTRRHVRRHWGMLVRTLREWRAIRLMSSKTLASAAGVSNKTILGIEHGRQVPTFRTIQRLSEALGVDPSDVRELADAIKERGQLIPSPQQTPSNG